MAKAALENAVWDLQAQMDGVPLARLLGGVRDVIPCGVSIGIQSSVEQLMAEIEKELAAGYQRIKLKCKPGWDVNVFSAVRDRWPGIMLSCDANSAYRLRDTDHLLSFDEFEMLMIEQPLWADDFYFHSMLQKQLETSVCLDESIRNRRDALAAIDMESCRIINIKVGSRWRFQRSDRCSQCGARARNSSLVRWNAGDWNRPLAQHRVVLAGELQPAWRCLRIQPLLGGRHHRAGSDCFGSRRNSGTGISWARI